MRYRSLLASKFSFRKLVSTKASAGKTGVFKRRKVSIIKRWALAPVLIALSLGIVASRTPTDLERIKAQGELRILSRNGPTTYYEGPNGMTGFEYALAKSFADELGVTLIIEEEGNLGILIASVGSERGYIGAAGLTVTPARQQKVRFAQAYLDVSQQLIYNRKQNKPSTVEDLVGADILVIANSSHAERLTELQQKLPALTWREQADLEMIDLVEMVHSGTVQYAIVDSNAFAINRKIFPDADIAFDISEPQQLAWAFAKQMDNSLYDAAQSYFDRIQHDGTLAEIEAHFYQRSDSINRSGAKLFASRIKSRLPKWQPYLEHAGTSNEIDWRLLAAVSYQESHWNSGAISNTGVRGLMMLTQAAAKDMGVTNRIDPEQSIQGGARYFKSIFDRIPQGVQGTDRTWMAVAAYNVGLGHLEDARVLTQQHGGNPNLWADVRKYLPLLSKRKYYQNTKHGYARGWEPVEYVQNVRQFYDILTWQQHLDERRLASANEGSFEKVNTSIEESSAISL